MELHCAENVTKKLTSDGEVIMQNLSDRMKDYESAYDTNIIGRVPVIIRCDGKGFSRWTKLIDAKKPFDENVAAAMSYAMVETARKIEGCVLGYTQSDEITFVLRNDQSLESTPWFGNRLQKIVSTASSMVTVHFASHMSGLAVAYFDARVFAVPDVQEAINCLIWRQNDAIKNSISTSCYWEVGKKIGMKHARAEMEGVGQKERISLLKEKCNIEWETYPTKFKHGIACHKRTFNTVIDGNSCIRSEWVEDNNIPVFSNNKDYLNKIFGIGMRNPVELEKEF